MLAAAAPPQLPPEVVQIDILPNQPMRWNGQALRDQADLEQHLQQASTQSEQAEIHVWPSKQAPYAQVAAVLAAAQRYGLIKIGLVGAEQF